MILYNECNTKIKELTVINTIENFTNKKIKTILVILIIVNTLFAETANFKKGAFGCESSNDIKGFWKAYQSGKTATYRFMFQHGCAFLPTDGWKIVKTGYITNKVCSDDSYCYWVEKEFFKEEK